MDEKMLHYNYMMPYMNGFNYPFPSFAPQGSQNLYVIVPTANPLAFGNFSQNTAKIEKSSPEEEILPDFRCKICSDTIYNYSDFKIHLEDHRNSDEELNLSSPSAGVQTEKQENYMAESGLLSEVNDAGILAYPEFKNPLSIQSKNTNAEFNDEISSENPSKQILEEYKKYLSMSLGGFDDAVVSTYPEFKSNLATQYKNIHALFNKPHLSEISPIQKADKPQDYLSEFKQFDDTKPAENPCYSNYRISPVIQDKNTDVTFNESNSSEVHTEQRLDKHDQRMATPKLLNGASSVVVPTNSEFKDDNINANVIFRELSSSEVHPVQTLDKRGLITPPKLLNTKSTINMPINNINTNVAFSELSVSAVNPIQTLDIQNDHMAVPKELNSKSTINIPINSKFKIPLDKINTTEALNKSNPPDAIPLLTLHKSNKQWSILKPLTHARENVFSCPYCTDMFKSRLELTEHQMNHQEMKDITCVLCKSSFAGISSLRKHLMMFHCKNKDRRQCSFCSYRCFQSSDLEKHIARRHTRDFKYKCSYCVKGFATPKELNNHLRRKHLDIKSVVEACCNGEL